MIIRFWAWAQQPVGRVLPRALLVMGLVNAVYWGPTLLGVIT